MNRDLAFIHRFEPGTGADAPPLVLLHGAYMTADDMGPLGPVVAAR